MNVSHQRLRKAQGPRLAVARAAALFAVLTAASGQTFAGTIYVLGQPATGNFNQNTSFGTIDTVTGTYTSITTNLLSGTLVKNLAWNETTNRFYTSGGTPANSDLRTLTTSGTVSASIGTINKDPGAMWYDGGTGTLSIYNRTNQQVGTVSTTTGSFTSSATSTTNFNNLIGGRGALLGGTAFMVSPKTTASASEFGRMNLTTGNFTSLATGTNFQYMVLASDGTTLYGLMPVATGSSILYSINTTNGSLTKVVDVKPASGNMALQFSGAAFAVPEPSTIALGLVGLAIAVGVRCRRKSMTQADPEASAS